eukprot:s810_g9.t1
MNRYAPLDALAPQLCATSATQPGPGFEFRRMWADSNLACADEKALCDVQPPSNVFWWAKGPDHRGCQRPGIFEARRSAEIEPWISQMNCQGPRTATARAPRRPAAPAAPERATPMPAAPVQRSGLAMQEVVSAVLCHSVNENLALIFLWAAPMSTPA